MICPELCLFLCHDFDDGIHVTAGDTIFYMQLTQGSPRCTWNEYFCESTSLINMATMKNEKNDWYPLECLSTTLSKGLVMADTGELGQGPNLASLISQSCHQENKALFV